MRAATNKQRGLKYFAIFRMRVQWQYSWRQIAMAVSLNHGHCSRIFRATQDRLQALGKENRQGVAHLRIHPTPDDAE